MTFVEISFKNAHTQIFHLYMLHLRWCPIDTLQEVLKEILDHLQSHMSYHFRLKASSL